MAEAATASSSSRCAVPIHIIRTGEAEIAFSF
jgi:hypothetical protein